MTLIYLYFGGLFASRLRVKTMGIRGNTAKGLPLDFAPDCGVVLQRVIRESSQGGDHGDRGQYSQGVCL